MLKGLARMKYVKWLAVLVACVIFLYVVVYTLFPDTSVYFHGEGTPVENLTAFFYLLASAFGIANAIRNRTLRQFSIVIAVLALVAFLDEISFGQFYLKYQPIRIGDKDIDAIHDIFGLIGKFILHGLKEDTIPTLAVIGVVGILVLAFLFVYRTQLWKWIQVNLRTSAFVLLICCAGLLFIAETIDVVFSKIEQLKMLEELFEMCASVAILFSALSIGKDRAVQV